ncbi:ParB/RepB/Spo0J family partition protein [Staphylococcus arlettae]|uniref:ParB/RepB/Spo0J family partition protein n=1 Tax=Staphylococcus arlettae TaxID=29378 RepID=UPI000D1A0917|nr:ParB/RepB/Spo0J family partition protein [Staphylococcus arlettae]PTH23194.1 chromosome partitioning protein ParB [Staphylococcus arlettae]PTH34172.1 chromosome partitioning protein ParB [Staphylococcus arlettae]PTH47954.1 chromosome partitioning protein ParB [Staphylococcus arlettae]PUZ33667.1 ParB/RepB/Spo0J family partition protein [Staphylococcus arlettae]RIM58805.1 ParB/RepB/Spo0J family partition protein [Staphylococcus arlettae]
MAQTEDNRLITTQDEEVQHIALDQIKANPYQPRKTFDDTKLDDLAGSIRQHGILQPIVLRQTIKGYHIVVGERRFRASQRVGLTTIPAIVKTMTDEDMMELAIIENLQREDLNAIEEAESYRKLMDDLQLTQQEVATRLSKSRPYIANMLRLLNLPTEIMRMIRDEQLSGAHGRTLLAVKDKRTMNKMAQQAYEESWSVRYLEDCINSAKDSKPPKQSPTSKGKPKFIQQQERQLRDQYGSKVNISTVNKKGHITFEFTSEEEFKQLIQQLNAHYRT